MYKWFVATLLSTVLAQSNTITIRVIPDLSPTTLEASNTPITEESTLIEPITAPIEPLSGEQKIQIAFPNTPRMIPIVKCESHFKQFENGKPLLSPTSDVGIMQINQVHWERAKELGLDIFNSEDDNIAMGQIILKEQGLGAWSCNKLI